MTERPSTLRELRESGYQPTNVKSEMRRNLIQRMRQGDDLFPGILGYDDTVIPQIQNAILSKHDMLYLGLRGQGKTRMLRMLVNLLDEAIPCVAGSEVHDDPLQPMSKFARDLIESQGDDCPIEWIGREERYNEKLATPDVTIADLIGEVDLIKHASGKHLSSEDVMHFGLIPRSHRGIFCMNELPDLSPKIQVGLFNVLEERDVQIRGFAIRLPLDLCLVFSANPEDYTNRGRIVTPLKDRVGSVIRTHYPITRETGVKITDANAWTDRDAVPSVYVPLFMKEIVEETSRLARSSSHVNQSSGVSVRMSIANMDNLISNAERRSILLGEDHVVTRISDLSHLAASSRGKLELNMTEEPGEEDRLLLRLMEEAVKLVFDQHLSPKQFRNVVEYFEIGNTLEVSDQVPAQQFLDCLSPIRGFADQIAKVATDLEPDFVTGPHAAAIQVACAEFILQGLHSHNRINKKQTAGVANYGL